MTLFRVEFSLVTQERTVIEQRAYRNGEDVVVLDVGIPAPDGYTEFDPYAQEPAE